MFVEIIGIDIGSQIYLMHLGGVLEGLRMRVVAISEFPDRRLPA